MVIAIGFGTGTSDVYFYDWLVIAALRIGRRRCIVVFIYDRPEAFPLCHCQLIIVAHCVYARRFLIIVIILARDVEASCASSLPPSLLALLNSMLLILLRGRRELRCSLITFIVWTLILLYDSFYFVL